MKKSHKIFLSVIFSFIMLASPLAVGFLWQENSIQTSIESSEISTPKIENISDASDENDNNEIATWTEPTYKTYDDYFTDYNITAETITEEDFLGTGSASDPYVVHSTKGFLYLTNYSLSKISLASKYFELSCDIILNEETFDEDGNPSGGDGVVYNWQPIVSAGNVIFEGNNFSIIGLFSNANLERVSLFSLKINKIANLKVRSVYIKATNHTYAVCPEIAECSNLNILSGTIISTNGYAVGFAYNVGYIKECNNYANIKCENGGAFGFAYRIYNLAEHCNNYGVCRGNYYASGLFGVSGGDGKANISHCNNYAEIHGERYVGGIISSIQTQIGVKVINCENHGFIYCGMSSGGIVGYSFGDLQIIGCKNSGVIQATASSNNYVGLIIGNIYVLQGKFGNVEIVDCVADVPNEGTYCSGIVGNIRDNTFLRVKDFKLIVNIVNRTEYSLFNYISSNCETSVENVEVILSGEGDYFFYFCRSYYNAKLEVNNLLVKGTAQKCVFFLEKQGVTDCLIQNCIFDTQTDTYYGTDFLDFFVDWKTGEIGLRSLSGKGFYQGKVHEEILQNKGYVKKEA